jgi:hypothetical protein
MVNVERSVEGLTGEIEIFQLIFLWKSAMEEASAQPDIII